MSKRRRVFLTTGLAIILVLAVSAGAFGAVGASEKTLSAIFRGIQINIDGENLSTEEEPFIVNGRTYVPLRVISEALGALVNWDSETSMVSISGGDAAVEAQLKEKDEEIAKLKAEIEVLKGNQPDNGDTTETEKSLLDLTERLKADYPKLENVTLRDIRLSGNQNHINVYIDVNLGNHGKAWEVLTDAKIRNWFMDICIDIQDYYSTDTSVEGRIIDTDSKDTLVELSKYRTQALKASFKDKDYRHGKGYDASDVESSWRGNRVRIADLDFSIAGIKLNKDEIDLNLHGSKVLKRDWDAVDSGAAEAAIKDMCKNIADSFINDAAENPKVIKVKVYDVTQASLGLFTYSVNDDTLR